MKHFTSLFILLSIFVCKESNGQVSGYVFRDFNGNGARDTSATFYEPLVQGITVKATLANNTVFSTTSSNTGVFTFSAAQVAAGSSARIEFSNLAKGDYAAFSGSGNGSNVQFATAPATNINFAVSAPEDYWNNIANPDPTLMVVQHPRGTYNGYNGGRFSVLQINNSTNGPSPATSAYYMTIDTSKRPARLFNTGSIFGIAFQKKQERFFMSAILKRHFGFGIHGAGGVYFLNKSGTNWSFGGGLNLQSVIPSNSTTALDFGSVTRVTTPNTDDNYISGFQISVSKSRDNDAFAKVATMSIGGIDADPNSDSIYLVNLFQKRLVVLNAALAGTSLNAATAATLGPLVSAYDLENLPGYPAAVGTGNRIRPFGIKIYKGRGYVGVVSDAMATQAVADLKGYVLSFDTKNIAAGFTTEITINFNLYRGDALRVFKPWVTTWAQAGGTATTNPKFCSQPIISDFEFNEDGSMDIAIRDRWGDQNALDYDAWPSATNAGLSIEQGDNLHACKVGNGWLLEGTAGSCVQPNTQGNPRVAPFNPVGYGNSYNNTGKEFYADVSGDNENESAEGSLAKLMGSRKIVSSTYDPIGDGMEPSGNYWYTQGLHWNDNITGKKTQMARTAISNTMQVNKVNGIGDIEFVSEQQPIQIGNLVWNDANGNGIQEAGDKGIPSVAVTLRSPGIDGIYYTADDQTYTTTTNATGNYFFSNSNISFTDNRKPATWTGVKGILPGYDYRLEIDTAQIALTGFRLAASDVLSNSIDNIDNDGIRSGTFAIADFNASFVTQDIDFGFKNLTTLAGFVWDDQNANGIQNSLEKGVANVVATLYDSLNKIIGTAVTDSTGHYLITNVPAGSGHYLIFSNLPVGGSFTAPNVGGENAIDNSNADLTGTIFSISILAGQHLAGFDAGIQGLNVPLPILLSAFSAVKSANNVLLRWKTATEIASQYFEIEKSANGIDFTKMTTVAAAGNSSIDMNYSLTDYHPYSGNNYYRLKLISQDAGATYSQIKLVNFNKMGNIEIYPNPVQAQLSILFFDEWINRTVRVILYNQLGQPVLNKLFLYTQQTEHLNVDHLPDGIYSIQFQHAGGNITNKKIQIRK